ncbi:MAG: DNA repair protein RecO [Ignavibacteriaceae bacterium]|nr:DNA repair protein RecO [Ignavibacteriaceae bacterium]
MSAILKTEAIVLNKINYGDTSNIVNLFTKNEGMLTAIVKGARSPKSKMGSVVDPLNYLSVIIYNKESRDVQLLTSADIISHFPRIKEDYEKLQYAHAVLELTKSLIPEHEPHERLFKGIVRILELFNSSNNHSGILFGRFFLFFLEEIGYEFQIEKCYACGEENLAAGDLAYNYDLGILCSNCKNEHIQSFLIDAELFRLFSCLKNNGIVESIKIETISKSINYLEKFLKHHVQNFKGLKSLQLFK